MMATAYLYKELISEICGFHRIELRHRDQALLYKMFQNEMKCAIFYQKHKLCFLWLPASTHAMVWEDGMTATRWTPIDLMLHPYNTPIP